MNAAIDDGRVAWETEVARFLVWAGAPTASALELAPCFAAGLVPLVAASRIIQDRQQVACDDVE